MGFHTFPVERADDLEDPSRYRYCSREELVAAVVGGPDGLALDLGCGTGFFTRDVAPFVEGVVAADVQPAMLDRLRANDPPAGVRPVAAAAAALPVRTDAVAVAVSTMTFHEYAAEAAHAEVHRVLEPGGRYVVVDWSREGAGERGPSLDERFDLASASSDLQGAGFHVVRTQRRPETFLLIARATA
ncbi:MAG: class I SAM-dependent methyltransferase [Halobacteriales archaeon]